MHAIARSRAGGPPAVIEIQRGTPSGAVIVSARSNGLDLSLEVYVDPDDDRLSEHLGRAAEHETQDVVASLGTWSSPEHELTVEVTRSGPVSPTLGPLLPESFSLRLTLDSLWVGNAHWRAELWIELDRQSLRDFANDLQRLSL